MFLEFNEKKKTFFFTNFAQFYIVLLAIIIINIYLVKQINATTKVLKRYHLRLYRPYYKNSAALEIQSYDY